MVSLPEGLLAELDGWPRRAPQSKRASARARSGCTWRCAVSGGGQRTSLRFGAVRSEMPASPRCLGPGRGQCAARARWREAAAVTATVVLDSSVLLKWFRQGEELADRALELRAAHLEASWRSSCRGWRPTRSQRAPVQEGPLERRGAGRCSGAARHPPDLGGASAALMRRAVALAHLTGATVYDTVFAALAEGLEATSSPPARDWWPAWCCRPRSVSSRRVSRESQTPSCGRCRRARRHR